MNELLGGRYQPVRVVGQGAQGQVISALDTRHDRLVALKVCPASAAALAEARALYACRPHAALPLLRDDFTDGDRMVLVMDWIEGAPPSIGAPLDRLCDMLDDVASALDHLHAHTPPLIHGDVKPANILMTAAGSAVLVDLGLVGSGVAAGTPGFMAPEAARGEVAPAMDIFSLAATVYALLTGAPPRPGAPPHFTGLTDAERTRVEAGLGSALALDPQARPASAAALVAALRGDATRRTNLPSEVTSFVGRHGAVDDVRAALRAARIVTLTGPGGIGKTRLALRAVTGATEPVWFAPLASVRDATRVASTVADALQVPDTSGSSRLDELTSFLGVDRVTIVLDNCEQVVEGAARLVDALTTTCPNVTVLATSREPLEVPGEKVIMVPPLQADEATPLFTARARAQRASLDFGDADGQIVREICARLDGLPLAIELAAANLRTTTLEDLAERVAQPLDLAGPRGADERQRTLRGLIGWSWELLSPEDQRAFAALSVFAGSIGVDEGTAVAGDRAALTRLADRSLLTLRGDRFEMLETVRAYAAERLEDAEAARQAHLDAIVGLAERAAPHLHGPHQGRWLDRLAADHANVRAAMASAIDKRDGESAMRLAASIARYLELRGYLHEGRELLDGALAISVGSDITRATVLRVAGVFAHRLGALDIARSRYTAALQVARELDDARAVSDCLHNLGIVSHMEGDIASAATLWEETLTLRRALAHDRGIADTLMNLSFLASDRGDLDQARAMLQECVATFESLGDRSGVGDAFSNLALVEEAAGDNAARMMHHRRSLEIRRELGDRWGVATSLANLAAATRDAGERTEAVRAFEEAHEMMLELGSRDDIASIECGLALAVDVASRGRALLASALEARASLHDPHGIAECLEALALLAPAEAPDLLVSADEMRGTGRFRRTPFEEARLAGLTRDGGKDLGLDGAVQLGFRVAGTA